MSPVWSIVLAAGQGRRLSAVTRGLPKQYWSPDGGPPLLSQTLHRLSPLSPLDRTITIVDQSHRTLAEALARSSPLGHLVEQPLDRGTAAGVALGLTEVLANEPDAIVLLSPSDHGVRRTPTFRRGLQRAIGAIEAGQTDVVLLGVQATGVDGEYGWITAAPVEMPGGLRRVHSFVEKPSLGVAAGLFGAGAVWNTMVLVARGTALAGLFDRHLPWIADVFRPARRLSPASRQAHFGEAYPALRGADFSRDLLTPADGLSLVTWPSEMGWSDLGTPERLGEWLAERRQPPTARGSYQRTRPALGAVA
jgi:mannose-1-phosphate guanylyltransferase